MSDNLHLEDMNTGEEIRLYQTPTWVTHMCMSLDENGVPDGGMEGVMRRYIYYVSALECGVWQDPKELERISREINAHIKEIKKVKKPRFYVL